MVAVIIPTIMQSTKTVYNKNLINCKNPNFSTMANPTDVTKKK